MLLRGRDRQLDAADVARGQVGVHHHRELVHRHRPRGAGGKGERDPCQLAARVLVDKQSEPALIADAPEGQRAGDGLDGLGADRHQQELEAESLALAGDELSPVRLHADDGVPPQARPLLVGEAPELERRHLSEREGLEHGQRPIVDFGSRRDQLERNVAEQVAEREHRLECGDTTAGDRDPVAVGVCGRHGSSR